MQNVSTAPVLFPVEPDEFLKQIRLIIQQEIGKVEKNKTVNTSEFQTSGLTYKPLYKIAEVCKVFQVTRPTIYDWIKNGKLKPYKIQSRVYFLWDDIHKLLNPNSNKDI
jgi:excisionase family DNA binding protein